MPRSVSPAPKAGVVKHRACDECRSRKLACSKELDGCSRCKREHIRCVYSPQKPMGRPRKRRNVDSPKDKGLDSPSPAQMPADIDLMGQHEHLQPYPPLEADYGYYSGDSYNANGGYMDFIPHSSPSFAMAVPATSAGHHSPATLPIDPTLTSAATYHSGYDAQFNFGGGLDMLGGVGGYDEEADAREMEMTRDLYLGLDALANLPAEPFAAIQTARRGSKIAYDVVRCPRCSLPLVEDPLRSPPLESFQNMMMLGAIIPSICNAYVRISAMVDGLAADAGREGRLLRFAFADLGGLWGRLTGMAADVDGKDLEPQAWRRAVVATLRADIYGFTLPPGQKDSFGEDVKPFRHPGLKQVVQLLEERSRIRHEKVDSLAVRGQHCNGPLAGPPPAGGPAGGPPHRAHQCMKLLEVAKIALDRLDIS